MNMGVTLRTMAAATVLALAPIASALAADERQSLEELRNTVVNLLNALVDQGVISREKAAQMVKAAQDKAAADAAAVAKSDEGAVRVPYVPQIIKDEIAKQVADEVKPGVVADVLKDAKSEAWGVPGALPEWLSRISLFGDVTIREEGIFYDADNAQGTYLNYFAINQAGGESKAGTNAFLDTTENRLRTRGRVHLGVEADITSSITAGARIATGTTSDLVSETQTLASPGTYAFGLDELYVRADERNDQKFPWLSVVAGRFLNPYETPTDLIFNKDLTFTGVAATGRFGLGDGSSDQSHLFMTVGAHPLEEIEFSAQDKWFAGGELGANLHWADTQQLRITGAFYDFFNVTGRLNPADSPGLYNYTAPAFLRQGNTVFNIANSTDPTVQLWAYASKFQLANMNATYSLGIGSHTLTVSADAVRNFGFNSISVAAKEGFYVTPRTTGYQAQVSFGNPTVQAPGAWRLQVGYRYLQRDAVLDEFTDSDFHFGGTDAEGYYVVGEVGLAKSVWIRARYLSSNEIDGPALTTGPIQLGIDTLQLDLNARF
ncbi:MAG: putative porin [Steroidobacteraceae bacterium]